MRNLSLLLFLLAPPVVAQGRAPPPWLAKPVAWKHGPLIDEDANTVAHVYWRNGALVDSKGNTWTQAGTVSQVASAGKTPPGAGPFSNVNYYVAPAASDALDIAAASPWTAVFVLRPAATNSEQMILGNLDSANGWGVEQEGAAGKFNLITRAASTTTQTTAAGVPSTIDPSVLCVGWSGSATHTTYLKHNLNTIVSNASASYAPNASVSTAMIGRYQPLASIFFTGVIWEIYVTTTAPSDAACTYVANQVKARIGAAW